MCTYLCRQLEAHRQNLSSKYQQEVKEVKDQLRHRDGKIQELVHEKERLSARLTERL